MFGKMMKLGFALTLGLAVQSQATIVYGGYITVAETGNVTATYLGHTAGYTNELVLYMPSNSLGVIFNNHTTPVGTTFDLGTYAAGTELQFAIHVLNTGETFYSGPGTRNPDGMAHVKTDDLIVAPEIWVGFEDLLGGGDMDFDDVQFKFSNTASVTELPAVPEPGSLALMGLGLLGMGYVVRRKRA